MLRTAGVTTTNTNVNRFLVTLDDEFCCLIELARKFSYLVGGGVLPAFKLPYF